MITITLFVSVCNVNLPASDMSNGHVDWDILKTTSTGLSHVLLGNRSTQSFFIFQHLFYVMTKLLISVVHVKKPFITVFNTILAIDMFTFRYTFYVNRYICYCKFIYYLQSHLR